MDLDYEPRQTTLLPPWIMRWARRVLVAFIVLAAVGVGILAVRAKHIRDADRQAIQTFKQATSKANLQGLTRDQVIARLGKPYGEVRNSDGSRDIVYQGPWGWMCFIHIKDGVVTWVEHDLK